MIDIQYGWEIRGQRKNKRKWGRELEKSSKKKEKKKRKASLFIQGT